MEYYLKDILNFIKMTLVKITPNKEKVRSIFKMVDSTLNMIETLSMNDFPSNITKEYYEIIRELVSIILLLDGYKTYGEGAHKEQIDYIKENYKQFKEHELNLIYELRDLRNRIAYDGFFVNVDFLKRKKKYIVELVEKLKILVNDSSI